MASSHDQFDIGAVITAPAKDPEWIQKCLIMGLLTLVPLVGGFNLSGWSKTIAEQRMAGETTLPPANLSYIAKGFWLMVAWLPFIGVLFFGAFAVSGAAAAAVINAGPGSKAAEGAIIGAVIAIYGGMFLFSGIAMIVGPAVNFLHVVDGERFSSLLVKRQWELMKDGGTQYLMLFVAVLAAGLVAQLGIFLFFVGIFLSAPYAQAMQGAALAEFARVTRPKSAGFPVDGSIGGASGSPFGMKI
jgi:hypothetical protein